MAKNANFLDNNVIFAEYMDPKLVDIGDDEAVTLYVQKVKPNLLPMLLKNKNTTMVVMPFTVDGRWSEELETFKADLFRQREKEQKAA